MSGDTIPRHDLLLDVRHRVIRVQLDHHPTALRQPHLDVAAGFGRVQGDR